LNRKFWLPVAVAIACGAAACAIAYAAAGNDVDNVGDWRHGALRFIGFAGALGVFGGYLVTARLVRGPRLARDGFTLTYRRIEPKPDGYRALETLQVKDLLAGLREVGYEPRAEACDELGNRRGKLDEGEALAGTNVAVVEPRVHGWIRVELPIPAAGMARGMGLVEIWSSGGTSAEELAMFAMRVLGTLVDGLSAARESSVTTPDPIATVTSGLADRPSVAGASRAPAADR
jgi:hypothetical protein